MRKHGNGGAVERDHVKVLVEGVSKERAMLLEGGVRDEQADVEIRDGGQQGVAAVDGGEIRVDDAGADAVVRLEGVSEMLETRQAARSEHDVQAGGGELARELGADAGGRARDQGPGPVALLEVRGEMHGGR